MNGESETEPSATPVEVPTEPVVKSAKLPPRKDRKELQYDYVPPRRRHVNDMVHELKRTAGVHPEIEVLPALDATSKVCTNCGESIPDNTKRFVILRAELPHTGLEVSATDRVAVLCVNCNKADIRTSSRRSADESWLADLSHDELQAWELKERGLNQSEIATEIGNHQSTVSRLLKRADQKRRDALLRRFRTTGGA